MPHLSVHTLRGSHGAAGHPPPPRCRAACHQVPPGTSPARSWHECSSALTCSTLQCCAVGFCWRSGRRNQHFIHGVCWRASPSLNGTHQSCVLPTAARRAGENVIHPVAGQLTAASLGRNLPFPPKTPRTICKQGWDFYFIALENATARRAGRDSGM